MIDPIFIAETYLAAWNAPNEAERRVQLEGWTEEACYVDPLMHCENREGIAAMIAAARAQFPGHRFVLAGAPDGHGNHVRFSWTFAPDDGAPVARGTDIVRLDAEGRITEVVGFLDGGAA